MWVPKELHPEVCTSSRDSQSADVPWGGLPLTKMCFLNWQIGVPECGMERHGQYPGRKGQVLLRNTAAAWCRPRESPSGDAGVAKEAVPNKVPCPQSMGYLAPKDPSFSFGFFQEVLNPDHWHSPLLSHAAWFSIWMASPIHLEASFRWSCSFCGTCPVGLRHP